MHAPTGRRDMSGALTLRASGEDAVSADDIVFVLRSFLLAEHTACGLCLSTFHNVQTCPRAWVGVVTSLGSSELMTEEELNKVKTRAT